MWQDIEAVGGCGGRGTGSASDFDCRAAEALCEDCNADVLRPTNGSVAALAATTTGQGASLGSDGVSLEMRCALPRFTPGCADRVADLGLGLVFVAGLVLLIVSMAVAALFDRYFLPPLIAWLQRPLQSPPLCSAMSGWRSRRPPAPEQSKTVAQPPVAEPPAWRWDVQPRPAEAPTAAAAPKEGGFEGLRQAAAGEAPRDLAPIAGHLDEEAAQDMPTAPAGLPPSCRSPKRFSKGASASSSGLWPPRLARIWALRTAFLWVAGLSAVVRLVVAALHVVLPAMGAEGRRVTTGAALLAIAPELLLCLPPLAWCAWASRPPSKADSRCIPDSVAYSCPCNRIPRFSALAVLVLLVELYSTLVSAAVVATAPCDMALWRVIFPYCLGIAVVVARAYSALLAVRLQDELNGATRKVLPVVLWEEANLSRKAGSGRLDAFSSVAAPNGAGGFGAFVSVEGLEVGIDALALEAIAGELAGGPGPRPAREGWWEATRPPRPPTPAPTARRRCLLGRRGGCCRRDAPLVGEAQGCRRHLGCRCALRIVVLLTVVFGTTGAIVARMTRGQGSTEPLPSSCITAQNGTATCEAFDIVGKTLWDAVAFDSKMDLADTQQDCCHGCDEVAGCQAWMFQAVSRQCRWIGFLDDPCKNNPGDLRCRCMTERGTSFGFKPTSRLIWVQRGSQ